MTLKICLLRRVLSFKKNLSLPVLSTLDSDIIWKINVKKIYSSNCFIKFIVRLCDEVHDVSIINRKKYLLYFSKFN